MELTVAEKIMLTSELVRVGRNGLSAEVAGETYEGSNPSSVARQLGNALYQTVHNGRTRPLDKRLRTLREPRFEARLCEAAGERTTKVPATVVGEQSGRLIIDTGTVRVLVPASAASVAAAGAEAQVAIDAVRPALSPGFVFASGGRRRPGPVLRLYARLDDPDNAPEVWRRLLDFLEQACSVWEAKILSHRILYPRNDALVVYLGREGWRHARDCAELLQNTGLLGVGTGSPFTRPITASVACAFEPDDHQPTRRGMSFGQHRAHILAHALIRHSAESPADNSLEATIHTAFTDAGIDPAEPARNLSSPALDVLGLS